MNTLYKHFLKKVNWLLAGLLALLGFGQMGCDKMYPVEYGTPHATYALKGKVVDEQNRPIPRIQVQIQSQDGLRDPFAYAPVDTIYTDEQGNFAWEIDFFSPVFQVTSDDTDEEANGGWFDSDTLEVNFSGEELTGGKGWYEGRAEKEVNIILKKYVDPHTTPYVLYTFYGQVTDEQGNPLPGVCITTAPSYYPENTPVEKQYAVRTNWAGKYRFSYDAAPPTEHVFYAFFPLNEYNRFEKDSLIFNFADIKLYGGHDLRLGKGSQEINFILKEQAQ